MRRARPGIAPHHRHTARVALGTTLMMLFFVAVAAWPLSYVIPIAYAGLGPISIGLGDGRAWLDRTGRWIGPPGPGLFIGAETLPDGWIFSKSTGTWRVNRNASRYSDIPVWPVVALLCIAALIPLFRRRPATGHCPCGYNLAGTPPGPGGSITCPECGRGTRPGHPIK